MRSTVTRRRKGQSFGKRRLLDLFGLRHWIGLLVLAVGISSSAAGSESDHFAGVRTGLLVYASPKHVFSAIRNQRMLHSLTARIISASEDELIVEECFNNLAIIGQATCTYREEYKRINQVDYAMIKSDKLKAFVGRWTLVPKNNGKETYLQLSSYVDTGLPIPFARDGRQLKLRSGDN